MRTNLIFLIFFLIISCSPKVNLELDIENLKKDGVVILQNKNIKYDNKEISDISKVATYPARQTSNWSYPNFNSNNLLPNINLDINFSVVKKDNFFNKSGNNSYKKEILKVENNIIFVDDKSTLFIINEDFKLLKKFQLHDRKSYNDYPLKFSLVSENNILFISDNLGSILAYDIKNYKIIWRNNLGVPFLSNLAMSKKSIFVTNSNGKIYSFDIFTGKQNWSFETGTQTAKSPSSYRVSVFNNKLLFSNDFGKITCIDLDKQVIAWSHTMQLSAAYHDINLLELADFVIENNSLYIASNFGRFVKLDLNNGKVIWYNDTHSTTTIPFVNSNTVALATDNGFFNIYDKNTGRILYKKNLLNLLKLNNVKIKNIKPNNIFMISGKIYITTNDGFVFLINSSDLQSITYKKLSNTINSNIAISNNSISFYGNDDVIFKIQ